MSLGKCKYDVTYTAVVSSASSYSCLSGGAIVLQAEDLGVVVIERGVVPISSLLRGIYESGDGQVYNFVPRLNVPLWPPVPKRE